LVSLCRRRCSRSPHPLAISTQALRYFASRLGLQCLLLTSGLTPLVRHSHPPRGARRPSLSERLADFDRASRGSTRTRTRIRCSPTASSLCSAPCTSTRSIHPLSLLAAIFFTSRSARARVSSRAGASSRAAPSGRSASCRYVGCGSSLARSRMSHRKVSSATRRSHRGAIRV